MRQTDEVCISEKVLSLKVEEMAIQLVIESKTTWSIALVAVRFLSNNSGSFSHDTNRTIFGSIILPNRSLSTHLLLSDISHEGHDLVPFLKKPSKDT